MRFGVSQFRAFAMALAMVAATTATVAAQQAQPISPATSRSITVESFEGAELTGGSVSADGLSALLIEVLVDGGQFSVVEKGSSAPPRYLIKGSITRYNPSASGAGVQLGGFSGMGRALGGGARTRTTTVGISLRLIEASTGQIVAIGRADGSATEKGADAGVVNPWSGSNMGVNAMRSTSMGQALEDAMKKAVAELVGKIGT